MSPKYIWIFLPCNKDFLLSSHAHQRTRLLAHTLFIYTSLSTSKHQTAVHINGDIATNTSILALTSMLPSFSHICIHCRLQEPTGYKPTHCSMSPGPCLSQKSILSLSNIAETSGICGEKETTSKHILHPGAIDASQFFQNVFFFESFGVWKYFLGFLSKTFLLEWWLWLFFSFSYKTSEVIHIFIPSSSAQDRNNESENNVILVHSTYGSE